MATTATIKCPKCGNFMWDNHDKKTNPKAPDFKCKDKNCDGVIWPTDETNPYNIDNQKPGPSEEAGPKENIVRENIEQIFVAHDQSLVQTSVNCATNIIVALINGHCFSPAGTPMNITEDDVAEKVIHMASIFVKEMEKLKQEPS